MGYHATRKPGQSKYTVGLSRDESVLKIKVLTGKWKWSFVHTMFCMCDINGAHARPTETESGLTNNNNY